MGRASSASSVAVGRHVCRWHAPGVASCVATIAPYAQAVAATPSATQILAAMKRATIFMVDKVSTDGGYVWTYLPDRSRRWGELEARATQIWIQPPGTATMGHLFLDAYHATGDEYYYRAARRSAGALIRAQHPSGGWNYLVDFAGERSLRELVRHRRPQCLAAGGVPALLGQRHVRRRRHGGVGEVPAAALRREARPELQARARQGDRVRARQPVSDRRLAAALPAARRVSLTATPGLHLVPHVQRRCRGGEHRVPRACVIRRSAIGALLDADRARHERLPA